MGSSHDLVGAYGAGITGCKEKGKAGRQARRQEGICGTVTILMKLGFGKTEIKQAVMEQYRLSETEAEKFLEVFNSN